MRFINTERWSDEIAEQMVRLYKRLNFYMSDTLIKFKQMNYRNDELLSSWQTGEKEN